jgi:hypothetical protein
MCLSYANQLSGIVVRTFFMKCFQAQLKLTMSLAVSLALMACGGGGDPSAGGNNDGNNGGSALTGSLVYTDSERVNGVLKDVIKVMNLSTKSLVQFVAGDDVRGGPSVSRDGTIAYMHEETIESGSRSLA